MIMTRETDYAVRILRALSCGERMTVRQVCDLELVPVQFAYKILKKLEKQGWCVSAGERAADAAWDAALMCLRFWMSYVPRMRNFSLIPA